MSKIVLKREVEESEVYDLVVCGGGPAGTAAAIAAARQNLKVVLIEQSGCLGGAATNSLVSLWLGSYSRDVESAKKAGNFLGSAGECSRPVVGGIFDEAVEQMVAEGQAIPARDDVASGSRHVGYAPWHGRVVSFESESCKRVLEQIAVEAGVEIQYFTTVIDCLVEDKVIQGVFVHSKSGFSFIRGKAFVDGTGDADVAAAAGVPTEKGREEDGLMSSASMLFVIEDVDSQAFEKYCKQTGDSRFRKAVSDYKKKNDWPFPFDIIICCEMPLRGRFLINTLRQIGVDGTDTASLTGGMIDGRKQAKELLDIMRKIVPGFEKARMVQTSSVIGIRDTRRIIGQYKLKVDDLINSRRFDDTIALSGYGWDMHNPSNPSEDAMKETPIPLPYTEIPYSILLPRGVDNLIVAGRCISVEWQALGPIRIMPACFAMGQAAGTAAVQVVQKKISFGNVDIKALRKTLRENGAILELE